MMMSRESTIAVLQDVRDVVRSYDGEEDVAAAFKHRMAQLAANKKSGGRFGMR